MRANEVRREDAGREAAKDRKLDAHASFLGLRDAVLGNISAAAECYCWLVRWRTNQDARPVAGTTPRLGARRPARVAPPASLGLDATPPRRARRKRHNNRQIHTTYSQNEMYNHILDSSTVECTELAKAAARMRPEHGGRRPARPPDRGPDST